MRRRVVPYLARRREGRSQRSSRRTPWRAAGRCRDHFRPAIPRRRAWVHAASAAGSLHDQAIVAKDRSSPTARRQGLARVRRSPRSRRQRGTGSQPPARIQEERVAGRAAALGPKDRLRDRDQGGRRRWSRSRAGVRRRLAMSTRHRDRRRAHGAGARDPLHCPSGARALPLPREDYIRSAEG